MDTIYALSTARGKAGVAIIRISGPGAHAAVLEMTGSLPAPRQFVLRGLRDGSEVMDRAGVVVFTAGASFTGEAVAELHLHGSMAVIASVLRKLSRQDGLRPAEPGEFTRRALENGCLDLAQVEGLADLIDAETEAQRRQAMRVLSGAVGLRADGWRKSLIRAGALVAATIDFADEDVPEALSPEVARLVETLIAELQAEVGGSRIAERIRDGFEVAIVGRPNSGKSTLLNMLAGREAAITSAVAGTTRDVIEVRMDLDGLAVTLLDTAGIRLTDDPVEHLGIKRALDRAQVADLRVILRDESGLPDGLHPRPDDLVLWGKADLGDRGPDAVSGLTGQGVDRLVARISDTLRGRVDGQATLTRERHRIAVLRAIEALESVRTEIDRVPVRAEIVADDLRRAGVALDSLVGRVDVEALLDEIFASFCIGK